MHGLPGMHTFTGCDTVSAIAGRGEVSALKVIKARSTYQEALKEIVEFVRPSSEAFKDFHAFFIMQDFLPLMSMACVIGFMCQKGEPDFLAAASLCSITLQALLMC